KGKGSGHVEERASVGDAERRGSGGPAEAAPDTFEDRRGASRDLQAFDVEWHGEQGAAECIREMAGRQIPRVTAPLNEGLALAVARQRLNDDLRLSHRSVAEPRASVKSNARPPGRICGPCASSPSFTLASLSGVPPSGATRMMPRRPSPHTIPLSSQLMPKNKKSAVGVTAIGAPPVTATRLIVRSV